MTTQLAFDLPSLETYRREDFFASPANATAVQAVLNPTARLLLIGPPGSGKTHLVHIWAAATGADLIPLKDLAQILPYLAPGAAIAIDAADAPDRDETALFHLHNLLAASGKLLLTATAAPRDWASLPDLRSRLQAMPTAHLAPPDDALLCAVLIKLFADRQITVAPNLIAYLISRMTRSIDAARRLVAQLDARALAGARPVSRSLAAELLDAHGTTPA